MRYRLVAATGLLLVAAQTSVFVQGAAPALPTRNGRPIVASVGRETVALDELVLQLGPVAERARLRQGLANAEELQLLDRLVNIRLVVQESTTMGIAEAPEIKKQVEVTSRQVLRDVLVERLVKDVRPDPAVVEKLYRESVREWKTASLLFKDEAAAQRAHKELAGGAPFAEVSARAVAAKAAKPDSDATYHAGKDYLPQIGQAVAGLRVGQVSPVIRLDAGFVVLKVVDIRYPENAAARADARKRALNQRQEAALAAHQEGLRRKHVVIDQAVLKSIDYEAAKPGVDALLKDKRVVAQIKGAPPVTVGDLSDQLRLQFFHGTDQAAQRKRMNERKQDALDATLARRLLNLEALNLGIDRSNAYRDRVRGYQDSLIFDAFVQKVIVPGNKMREEEVRRHYDGHLKEYSYPEMMKLRSVAFTRRTSAESAMRRLREGADYAWLAANAEGRAAKGAEGLLEFDGRPVTTASMPDGLKKVLSGAKAGEHRLYAASEGHFYVVSVQQVIASSPKRYDEVREEIAKKLYGEKLKKSVDEYTSKLRAHAKVETYLKRVR